METTVASNRIHPLMATAAVSLTLVSLVGAAAIAGLLPNSHGAVATASAGELANSGSASAAQPSLQAPVERELVRHKAVLHREYPRISETAYGGEHAQVAQVETARDYRQAPAYPQPAPVAQNSPLGIGIGALVGGLVGSRIGGGNGRTLAAIAGAVGGGYVGNEIAKRDQPVGQQ
ncbi:glycine zipper 2TM domain-containing protein [Rugamonas apoptosis]|uniref:Glycine zipper 2TM domain-containing protein n=1 Tax=Rugamonas apoptosis TaxID=2758570 RepID=A0A7W2FF94_9BURK|nr:glycine zipper 2TM domain-containing protein [Rugamonas apoptosis]MBA5690569.1 glycine zipper 2TM domain-containing protein [Rugamonas apoptosis]